MSELIFLSYIVAALCVCGRVGRHLPRGCGNQSPVRALLHRRPALCCSQGQSPSLSNESGTLLRIERSGLISPSSVWNAGGPLSRERIFYLRTQLRRLRILSQHRRLEARATVPCFVLRHKVDSHVGPISDNSRKLGIHFTQVGPTCSVRGHGLIAGDHLKVRPTTNKIPELSFCARSHRS
jgi:hypothetical protein